MKFYLTDTREEKEITVKSWNGSGYDPDCFYDLEIMFPTEHEKVNGGEAYMCTSEEYEEVKEWWTEEIEAMNAGRPGNDGTDYSKCSNEDIYIFAD